MSYNLRHLAGSSLCFNLKSQPRLLEGGHILPTNDKQGLFVSSRMIKRTLNMCLPPFSLNRNHNHATEQPPHATGMPGIDAACARQRYASFAQKLYHITGRITFGTVGIQAH